MDRSFVTNFLKASISASFGTFSSIFFHFASVMIMARYVPKEDFGIYLLILVIINCLTIFGGLGLDLTLVKFISDETQSRNSGMFITVVAVRTSVLLILAAGIYLFGYLLIGRLNPAIGDFMVYILALFFLSSFRDLFYNLFQGLRLFKRYASTQIFSALLRFGLILAALFFHRLSLHTLVLIETWTVLLTVLFQGICIPFSTIDTFLPNGGTLRSLIRFGFPLYLNNILTFLYSRINVIIIGAFLSPASVAFFEVANKIPEGFLRMFRAFIVVYFPNQSNLFSKGEKKDAQNLMNMSLFAFSFTFCFLTLLSFLFGKEIVHMAFSDAYTEVSIAFSLLMLNFTVRAITNIMGYSIVSAGRPDVPVKVNILSSLINIAGALVMIPSFGYMGAVYSILVMDVVSHAAHCLYLFRVGIVPRIEYLKPVLILAPLIGLYLAAGNETVLFKGLLTLAYIGLSLLFIKDIWKMKRIVVEYRKGRPGFAER
jgi:O-antigen/teichoic acid export membrane protein